MDESTFKVDGIGGLVHPCGAIDNSNYFQEPLGCPENVMDTDGANEKQPSSKLTASEFINRYYGTEVLTTSHNDVNDFRANSRWNNMFLEYNNNDEALRFIVAQCNGIALHSMNDIEQGSIELTILIARFVSGLSVLQRVTFCDILSRKHFSFPKNVLDFSSVVPLFIE